MELNAVKNTTEFKKSLFLSFNALREENPSFNTFIYEVSLNNNLFIVGGYLRCIANNEEPRDLDLIINIDKRTLDALVKKCFPIYTENRLGGYKITLEKIVVDAWSIEDNWAFKWQLVKNVDVNYLEKIAKGTFFNYDSLVFDLHTLQYNFKNYNHCAKSKELDILKKNSNYKRLNPTREANILRAFYLKERYALSFSEQLQSYILEYLKYAGLAFGDGTQKLRETLLKYKKYQHLLNEHRINQLVEEIQQAPKPSSTNTGYDLFTTPK